MEVGVPPRTGLLQLPESLAGAAKGYDVGRLFGIDVAPDDDSWHAMVPSTASLSVV